MCGGLAPTGVANARLVEVEKDLIAPFTGNALFPKFNILIMMVELKRDFDKSDCISLMYPI